MVAVAEVVVAAAAAAAAMALAPPLAEALGLSVVPALDPLLPPPTPPELAFANSRRMRHLVPLVVFLTSPTRVPREIGWVLS